MLADAARLCEVLLSAASSRVPFTVKVPVSSDPPPRIRPRVPVATSTAPSLSNPALMVVMPAPCDLRKVPLLLICRDAPDP